MSTMLGSDWTWPAIVFPDWLERCSIQPLVQGPSRRRKQMTKWNALVRGEGCRKVEFGGPAKDML